MKLKKWKFLHFHVDLEKFPGRSFGGESFKASRGVRRDRLTFKGHSYIILLLFKIVKQNYKNTV
jgi:hypothetical protein